MHLSGDILQASDDLSHVINSYKRIVEGQTINGETEEAQRTQSSVRQGTSNWLKQRTVCYHCVITANRKIYAVCSVWNIFKNASLLCASQLNNLQYNHYKC